MIYSPGRRRQRPQRRKSCCFITWWLPLIQPRDLALLGSHRNQASAGISCATSHELRHQINVADLQPASPAGARSVW